LDRRGIGKAAGLVVVRLEGVKKTGNRFAHAFTVASGAFVRDVTLESVGLKCLFAKDRKGAIIRIIDIVKKHPNCSAQRGYFRLQVDDSVGHFLVHCAAIQAKLLPGQPNANARFPPKADMISAEKCSSASRESADHSIRAADGQPKLSDCHFGPRGLSVRQRC